MGRSFLPIREELPLANPSLSIASGRPPQAGAPEEIPAWLTAVRAAQAKQASDLKVLDLRKITSFADFFVICTGSNPKQIQAIGEEVGKRLADLGEYPISVEGYQNADWVLADYGNYLIHIFSPAARDYYDLDRLWRHAQTVQIPEE